jgi:hypothetical protein
MVALSQLSLTMIIIATALVLLAIAIYVSIIRWALRTNEQINLLMEIRDLLKKSGTINN